MHALPRQRRRRPRPATCLRFTPMAWAKLLFLRDLGATEIGGFGLSRPDDLLLVDDVALVAQQADVASVVFDDLAVAEFFEEQIDAGRRPEEFGRIWIHTHPGDSPRPSVIDEETFDRAFGRCDWAVMAILARGGASYARLTWTVGPGGSWRIPVEVDFSTPFGGSDYAAWQTEHEMSVRPVFPMRFGPESSSCPGHIPRADSSRVSESLDEHHVSRWLEFPSLGVPDDH